MTDACRASAAIALWAVVGWQVAEGVAAGQFFGPTQFVELSSAVHVDEADNAIRAQLVRVRACVADKQWDEAVETLRQIMENPGGKMIGLTDRHYVNLTDYCHAQIAALPPAALGLYRRRVDALAQKWFEEGFAQHDRSRLAAIVAQMFCSSWGDKALLALGDMALEQGQYGAARGYWEKMIEHPPEVVTAPLYQSARQQAGRTPAELSQVEAWYQLDNTLDSPAYRLRHDRVLSDGDAAALVRFWKDAAVEPTSLAYPATTVPLADIRARLVLASILEGSLGRAADELAAFTERHPNAEGVLAGRHVPYAAALASLLEGAASWPARRPTTDWLTFAGSPARNLVPAEPLEVAPKQAWPAIDLGQPISADVTNARTFSSRRVAEDVQGLLSYHPVVAGDLLLVNNQTQIMAFNLDTGKPAWSAGANTRGEFYLDSGVPTPARMNRGLGVPRFTMTAYQGRLYARMGSQVTGRSLESPDLTAGHLVCLDLSAQGRLCWKILPDDDKWSFEGAPVVDGANLYVAMRKSDVCPQEHIACFDAETGRRKWRTLICAAETPAAGQAEEMTHNLLTLEEGTLYCNTNLGAVAAISADGQTQWVTLYPRARRATDRRAAHFYRDLNPAVYYRGLLLVAPSDCEEIFAVDAASGRMIWETHLAEDTVHLLGVGAGNLLASGDRLWWIDAAGGKVVGRWPDETPHGYGRGVLADGRVYWPTREALYVFDQQVSNRQQVTMVRGPIALAEDRQASGGNLVPADGMLLIAAASKIYGFRQPGKQPADSSPSAKTPPADPSGGGSGPKAAAPGPAPK